MARTDSLNNFLTDIANSIRNKKGTTDTIPASNFDTEIESIETDPNLQSKSITINENGTQNIIADEGYDGLNSVEVTTNVPSGGDVPEIGFIVNEFNSSGYATKITIVGLTTLPSYMFSAYDTTYSNAINKYLQYVVLHNGVTSIDKFCFYRCKNLIDIKMPDGLTTIKDNAFPECEKLALTELPNSITTIGANAFKSCTNLKLTKLPDNLTSMNNYVFNSCKNLALTELPNNLTVLNTGVFSGCSNLALTKIPDSVTTISQSAFGSCKKIVQLSMKNVSTIGGNGFSWCTGLKAIWIGNQITSSGFSSSAFASCASLTKMFIDLPRETVESFTGYQYAFMSDSTKTGIIVCNDDEGFMTKEEFDAIDWSTYTE